MKHLCKWMQKCNITIQSPPMIKKAVNRASINAVMNERKITGLTCFAMNPPQGNPMFQSQRWFKPKTWVSDSCSSKTLALFRTCNSGLGNRAPASDGKKYKLCPLCMKKGRYALNNEVHMVIDCPELLMYRQACGLGNFLKSYRTLNPQISSLKLYALFVNDSHITNLHSRALDLYSMKVAWHSLTGISMKPNWIQ